MSGKNWPGRRGIYAYPLCTMAYSLHEIFRSRVTPSAWYRAERATRKRNPFKVPSLVMYNKRQRWSRGNRWKRERKRAKNFISLTTRLSTPPPDLTTSPLQIALLRRIEEERRWPIKRSIWRLP